MDKEVWKPVVGYVHEYAISNYGNIRSFKKNEMKELVIKYKPTGYAYVCLCLKGVCKYHHIHRLVAAAFIPNPHNKPEVNHLDCDKKNNHVENLEWSTRKENAQHARKNIVYKNNNKTGFEHHSTFPIIQKSTEGETLYIWGSGAEASKHYNVSPNTITGCLSRSNIAIGFLWEKSDNYHYIKNKHLYSTPPNPVVLDVRKRDLTAAKNKKQENLDNITCEFLIGHGIKCFKIYGNIYRDNWELYARTNKIPSYGTTVNKFGTYKNFQEQVVSTIIASSIL